MSLVSSYQRKTRIFIVTFLLLCPFNQSIKQSKRNTDGVELPPRHMKYYITSATLMELIKGPTTDNRPMGLFIFFFFYARRHSRQLNIYIDKIAQTRDQAKAAAFSVVKRRSQLRQETLQTNQRQPTRLFWRFVTSQLCARLASFYRLLYFWHFTVLFFLYWTVRVLLKESPIGNYPN